MQAATAAAAIVEDVSSVPPSGQAQASPAVANARSAKPQGVVKSRSPASEIVKVDAVAAPAEPVEDDEAWLARQVASSQHQDSASNAPSAAGGWDNSNWEEDTSSPVKQPLALPAPPISASGTSGVSSLLDEMEALSVATISEPASNIASAPKAVEAPDDFFAAFGVK
jgi:hypothetical protein